MPVDTRNTMPTAMIVDDAFFMRNLLRSILEREGYTVVAEAVDGDDAVAKYRDCRPDLVLMDILMPVKNGIDATREIISFDKDASVVMCSIIGQELLVWTAWEAGARGVIHKPFSTEEVTAVLQQVIAAKFTMKKEVNRRKTGAVTLMEF
jgi:two-component system, chemotaxis family, chemotaxis protein CheY